MKISYAITVCDESIEIQRLVNFLVKHKRKQDEIIVQFDSKNGNKNVEDFLRAKSTNGEFNWHFYEFQGDFSHMKNRLTDMCNGDYIYQIDADEMVSEFVLDSLPEVLQQNEIDVLKVPRINTVEGITPEHIETWGWGVNEHGWINFPDFQWRIYKNNDMIRWKNKVHEVLEGYKTMSYLPTEMEWCLLHDKTIKRQERQNKLYQEL